MRMGEHENGRLILSLDFDICGKKDELTKFEWNLNLRNRNMKSVKFTS